MSPPDDETSGYALKLFHECKLSLSEKWHAFDTFVKRNTKCTPTDDSVAAYIGISLKFQVIERQHLVPFINWLKRKRNYSLFKDIVDDFQSIRCDELRNELLEIVGWSRWTDPEYFFENADCVDQVYQYLKGTRRLLAPVGGTYGEPPLQKVDATPSVKTTPFEDHAYALKLFQELAAKLDFSELWYAYAYVYKCANSQCALYNQSEGKFIKKRIISNLEHSEIENHRLPYFISWLKKKRNYYLFKEIIDAGSIWLSPKSLYVRMQEELLKVVKWKSEWPGAEYFFEHVTDTDRIYQYLQQFKDLHKGARGAPLEPPTRQESPKQEPIEQESFYDKVISSLCVHHVAEVEKKITHWMLENHDTWFYYPLKPSIISDHVANHIKTASRGQFECTYTESDTLRISVGRGAAAPSNPH